MTHEQRMKNLSVPSGKVDVVLDTDTFNEIDDQFAIAYLLKSKEKLNTKAIYAAPFLNNLSKDAGDGMRKSYDEIKKILSLMNEELDVYKGSDSFLKDETTPVVSDAAKDLAERANSYSPENPLYVVAIGAITNVASAILLNPKMIENTVVLWLGGHARHFRDNGEFNCAQDVAAARVVMGCGVPFVQLPCWGVVSSFTLSKLEAEYWLLDKTPISDYLGRNMIRAAESYASGTAWTRVIWDVTAVAWLLNDNDRFMLSRTVKTPKPTYDHRYEDDENGHDMTYVFQIWRDRLMTDLINKLTE